MTDRASARHKRRIRVTIGTAPVMTLDIGAGGFAAELMRVLPVGSKVQGIIRMGGKDAAYRGEVVWNKPGDARIQMRGRMGVRFTDLPPEAARLLRSPAFSQIG
jgi:hypothetical protein